MPAGHHPGQQSGHQPGQPDTGSHNPYIRWRTETHTRQIPHSADGIHWELQDEPYEVQVPVPPRDWDQIVLRALTAITITLVTLSLIWSTSSIGDLLVQASVWAVIAYGAAMTFDLAWIGCMAAEWLSRYDPKRAALPRWAGHIALLIAMLAVGTHGWLVGHWAVGLLGAAVSLIAKGLWVITLKATAPSMSERDQKWLAARRGRASARLATAAAQRQVMRIDAQHAALGQAMGASHGDPTVDLAPTDSPVPSTVPDSGTAPALGARTVRSAALAAQSVLPAGATHTQIAQQLVALGVETDPDTVRSVLNPDTEQTPHPVLPPVVPGPDSTEHGGTGWALGDRTVPDRDNGTAWGRDNVRPIRATPSVRDTIYAALLDGVPADDLPVLRRTVAAKHGDVKPDNFRKSRLRAVEDFRRSLVDGLIESRQRATDQIRQLTEATP